MAKKLENIKKVVACVSNKNFKNNYQNELL